MKGNPLSYKVIDTIAAMHNYSAAVNRTAVTATKWVGSFFRHGLHLNAALDNEPWF